MDTTDKNGLIHTGTILAALGASLCCILPVAVAILGVGSAALAARFTPLRPYLLVVTVVLLGIAFYRAYRPRACEPGATCAVSANLRRQRLVLWIVAALALILSTFPYYSVWLF